MTDQTAWQELWGGETRKAVENFKVSGERVPAPVVHWLARIKAARTHLMDAVPVTLGQEFGGYAAQVRLGADRVRDALGRVAQIPLGGTATGTGLNTHPEFAQRVRAKLEQSTGVQAGPPADPF